MVSTYTANKGIQKPANGDQVGVWDVPVNANSSIIDMCLGQSQTISLAAAAGSILFSTVQIQSFNIVFTGAMNGNVAISIPSLSTNAAVVSGGFYTVQNQTTTSSLTITIGSTIAGAQIIGVPPYEPVDILVEGTGGANPGAVRYRNLGRIGTYWDYAGSSVPNWVDACSPVKPYLLCDGSKFSSGTYPALNTILGSTTLPDSIGRFRATLNASVSRITSTGGAGSLDGNTIFSGGGAQLIDKTNLPNINLSSTGLTATSTVGGGIYGGTGNNALPAGVGGSPITAALVTVVTSISGTIPLSSNGGIPIVPPAYVGGITLIRSA